MSAPAAGPSPTETHAAATLDRATQLAADRTMLAAERTYAAWVRTGLAALAAGVGAKALLHDLVVPPLGTVTGAVLVAFSAFCFLAAIWREFHTGYRTLATDVPRLPSGLLIGVNGTLCLVALAALYGVIVGR